MSETSDNNLVDKFKRLLEEFKKRRSKNEDTRTFLDIIRVYYDRFEERCSKILGFFLDPNAEHGFGGLFINALIDSIKEKNKNSFDETGDDFNYSTVEIHLEEKTDYVQKVDDKEKRIDINVVTDSFVISIENKIDAAINNPFPIYVEHCEKKYNKERGKKVIYVLLSLYPIKDNDLKMLHVEYGEKEYIYKHVTYSMLFDKIKHRIGLYVNSCNKSYLPFLFDFIKTLENKVNNSNMEVNELCRRQ